MKKRLLAAILAGVGIVMLTATPSFASTAQFSIADPRYDQSYSGHKPSLAQKRQADIVNVAYGRGTSRVWVRIQVRDLNRQASLPFVEFYGRGATYMMSWARSDGTHSQLVGPSGQNVCGAKGRVKISYPANFIQMGFPKWCFRKGYQIRKPSATTVYDSASGTVHVRDSTRSGHFLYPNP